MNVFRSHCCDTCVVVVITMKYAVVAKLGEREGSAVHIIVGMGVHLPVLGF